MKEEGERGAL